MICSGLCKNNKRAFFITFIIRHTSKTRRKICFPLALPSRWCYFNFFKRISSLALTRTYFLRNFTEPAFLVHELLLPAFGHIQQKANSENKPFVAPLSIHESTLMFSLIFSATWPNLQTSAVTAWKVFTSKFWSIVFIQTTMPNVSLKSWNRYELKNTQFNEWKQNDWWFICCYILIWLWRGWRRLKNVEVTSPWSPDRVGKSEQKRARVAWSSTEIRQMKTLTWKFNSTRICLTMKNKLQFLFHPN